ncbi:aldehyde dehydrogenase family protein [Bradyrhizobium brasilense]|uniref:aldehyde dehydrogenase family protein n=1 Tax=Bradyrhizobium brasilense TaxID=1419277 RepID=UPI0024B134E1|nr:aldehyde dehydrogenase family protein [Bradyrhizobium australafricanum]WFU34320.1 aldehyde dehydrogenase family protein [Bradyrhizobium australafricanum]
MDFSFWWVFRFAAPNLMAGNAALLEHASNAPGCALAIEQIFRDAGFPENLFRTLMIGNKQVDALIEHPLVRAVTLTGSGAPGRAVASKAIAALKKTVLELGVSEPLSDPGRYRSRLRGCHLRQRPQVNSGQSCIAAKRFIVVEKVWPAFEKRFVELMSQTMMGDPFERGTEIGPLARHDLRDTLHRQVAASVGKGARLLLGGTVPNHPGAYYPADSPHRREERHAGP